MRCGYYTVILHFGYLHFTHTSDFSVKTLSRMDSGAIHRMGSLPLKEDTYRSVFFDRPKSVIFRTFLSATSTFLQARSLCTTDSPARNSCEWCEVECEPMRDPQLHLS